MHVPGVRRLRRHPSDVEVIYLVSPAGHPNYGDELIARAWLRFLAKTRPRSVVILDCHTPGQASLLLRDVHPHAIFVDTLWQLTSYAADTSRDDDGPDPSRPWEWVAEAASTLGPAPRLAEGVDTLHHASTIHLLGGGYLNAVWPQHTALFVAAAAVARRHGARAVATGQGLIPRLPEPAWSAFRDAADTFTVFDVRDRASADLLTGSPGLRRSGDDAWLAVEETESRPPAADRRPGVTLCLQSDLVEDFTDGRSAGVAALADFVGATLDAWDVDGRDVTVVEGIPGHDSHVTGRLGDRLRDATIVPFLDVWRNGLPVGAGDTWISTRFHPHLVAAAAGDSGVAVVPRPDYYATKHASLIDDGSRWSLADDGRTIPERPHAGGFPVAARRRARDRKLALARELYPRRH